MNISTESSTCLYLDQMWDTAMTNANALVYLPVTGLKVMKAAVYAVQSGVLQSVASALSNIESAANKFMVDSTNPVKNENLCRAVLECKAALEYMIPKNPDDDSYMTKTLIPNKQIRDTMRNYVYGSGGIEDVADSFDKWYCKLSMIYAIDSMLSDLALALIAKLEELLRRLDPITNKLDSLISDYMERIAPFLSILDSLDKFKGCAMASCDYATTGKNYTDDQANKMYVSKTGDTWVFSSVEWLDDAYTQLYDLNERIYNTKQNLVNWVNASTSSDVKLKAQSITSNSGSYGKSYI